MAQKKYYAIKMGRETGVFDNWNECKKHIQGFSGAIYKSFSSYEEAYNYVSGDAASNPLQEDGKEIKAEVEAYVDGSYMNGYQRYAYGCVILHKDEVIRLAGVGIEKEYVEMRNVAGELLGAMKAIEWAHENKCASIMIYHDYEGIERWANGNWKANKQGTQEYVEFIKDYRKYLDIKFTKVRAHTGDKYNEEADQLAKKALLGEIKDGHMKVEKRESTGNSSSIYSLDEEMKIFKKIMKVRERKKNSIDFIFKEYVISESKLIKFAKEVWELKGYDKNALDTIEIKFDIENSKIQWTVTDKEGNKKDFQYEV
ncbi:ribonuclease H1 domain-containing protein [Alkaliphilus hydrothermalis]|uniref:ribonuclease H n=1 Tax=Alkaliphilus hydrothermalis TaxID=1482730 RepID=A0ABS2NNA3_9FIRM|nr:ribonuclease HI [Alkaliphilus hydrothermalis]